MEEKPVSRREFLKVCTRITLLGLLASVFGFRIFKNEKLKKCPKTSDAINISFCNDCASLDSCREKQIL